MELNLNRNQFFLIGLVLLLLGLQFRLVDTFVLNEDSTRFLAKQKAKSEENPVWSLPVAMAARSPMPIQRKRIRPPRWLALSLISVGAVLVLHSFAMKKPD
jgi:hypothetical protein